MEYRDIFKKARTVHLTLPSGVEIDFVLPSTADVIKFVDKTPEAKEIIELIKKGLPEDLPFEDLPLQDFLKLQEVVMSFFVSISNSQSGSENSQGS